MGKTENKNLSEFIRAINADADMECERIKNTANEEKKEKLYAASKELEKNYLEKISRTQKNLRSENNREMTELENKMRDELITKRESIRQNVFKKVEQKLNDFVKTQDYKDFLCNSAQEIGKALKGEKLIIYIRNEDEEFSQLIKQSLGKPCEVVTDSSIHIGGLKASTDNQSANDTLDYRLENEREWFIENSGLKIV